MVEQLPLICQVSCKDGAKHVFGTVELYCACYLKLNITNTLLLRVLVLRADNCNIASGQAEWLGSAGLVWQLN